MIEPRHVAQVTVDPNLQMRAAGLNSEWVEELVVHLRAGGTFADSPVVFECEEGGEVILLLAGGFHRHEAYLQTRREIAQYDVRYGTREEALRFAVGDNAEHGLRRTDADKRRAVTAALADPILRKLSDREIDRICRVSDGFTSRVRKELTGAKPDPKKSAAAAKRNAKPEPKATERETSKEPPSPKCMESSDPPEQEPEPGELFPEESETSSVPIHVREAVASRRAWDDLLRTLRDALERFDKLATGPAGDWLRGVTNDSGEPWVKAMQVRRGSTMVSVWSMPALLAAVQLIRHARPDRVCAGCNGRGCGCCKSRGYLPASDSLLPNAGETLDLFNTEAGPW